MPKPPELASSDPPMPGPLGPEGVVVPRGESGKKPRASGHAPELLGSGGYELGRAQRDRKRGASPPIPWPRSRRLRPVIRQKSPGIRWSDVPRIVSSRPIVRMGIVKKHYAEVLGVKAPSLEAVKDHRQANTYSLMIVALLKRGGPMTLAEVADRFAQAGIQPAADAHRSLKRCRPARPPIYRSGELYELDVHDDELDLWLFRLGLRGPKAPPLKVVRREPEPLPDPEVPLTAAEIQEAFRDAHLYSWSPQRLAIAVLEAHGRPMRGTDVVNQLDQLNCNHLMRVEVAELWRAMAIHVGADGRWTLVPDHPAVRSARKAVRERLQAVRRRKAQRIDPAVQKVYQRKFEERRAAHAAELSRLRRVLLYTFPDEAPQAVSLVNVTTCELTTWIGAELKDLPSQLARFDLIGAIGVRQLLRELAFDPGERHLAELGPPKQSHRLNRRGRTLGITTELLIRGSCGIPRPFSDPEKLRLYLHTSQTARLGRRLEADLKSLFALYRYGRLHGACRLRWGFVDEMIALPWVHRDEPVFRDLMRAALERGVEMDVVAGRAPAWEDPWARSFRCRVVPGHYSWELFLVDGNGVAVDERDVQLAKLCVPSATGGGGERPTV